MQKVNSEQLLREAILQLEARQVYEQKILRDQFNITYERMKPVNLLKNAFKEVSESPELKNNVMNTSVGLATGYLSKVLFEGASHSPVRKLLGSALMFGITNIVARHPDAVRKFSDRVLQTLEKWRGTRYHEIETQHLELKETSF
jgi:hypothetical protein